MNIATDLAQTLLNGFHRGEGSMGNCTVPRIGVERRQVQRQEQPTIVRNTFHFDAITQDESVEVASAEPADRLRPPRHQTKALNDMGCRLTRVSRPPTATLPVIPRGR